MEWHEAIKQLSPGVVRILTPQGSGTGWLVSRSSTTEICGIATAAHVIEHAHFWEEPIRLYHPSSGKAVVLRAGDRAVHLDSNLDSAALVFSLSDFPLPDTVPTLLAEKRFMKPGVEIGWLGFPAIPNADLCFFSGRVSAYLKEQGSYLIDGVAINGVSGGPAFSLTSNAAKVIGIVSAYIPNRATGEILPGVSVVREVTHFRDLTVRFRSFDEAKAKESTPSELPLSVEPASGDSSSRKPNEAS